METFSPCSKRSTAVRILHNQEFQLLHKQNPHEFSLDNKFRKCLSGISFQSKKKADHDLAYKQGIRQVQSIKQVQGQSIKQVQGLGTIPPCFMFLIKGTKQRTKHAYVFRLHCLCIYSNSGFETSQANLLKKGPELI